MSAIIFLISSFLGSKPRARMATLSSLADGGAAGVGVNASDLLLLLLGETGGAALALVAASGTNSLEREGGGWWSRLRTHAVLTSRLLR